VDRPLRRAMFLVAPKAFGASEACECASDGCISALLTFHFRRRQRRLAAIRT
jgi:hypothetical protein